MSPQAPPPWMRMFPQPPKPVHRPDMILQPGVGQIPLQRPLPPPPPPLPQMQPPRPHYPAPPAPPIPWNPPQHPMGGYPQPQPGMQAGPPVPPPGSNVYPLNSSPVGHVPMGYVSMGPQTQSQNAPVPAHACGVKVSMRPEELDALLRGGPGSFVRINGINQCGSAISVVIAHGDAPMANMGHVPMGGVEQPHAYDPAFDQVPGQEE